MVNPNNKVCYHDECENELRWDSDGSKFDNWVNQDHGIKVDGGKYCIRYTSSKMNDRDCDMTYNYVCEFKCPTSTKSTSEGVFL